MPRLLLTAALFVELLVLSALVCMIATGGVPDTPRQLVWSVGAVVGVSAIAAFGLPEFVARRASLHGILIVGSVVFALQSPTPIGPGTTAWLNTDQNTGTGFRIFGTTGGAEFNVDFDITGTPRLYTGAAGETRVAGVTLPFAFSADRTIVEFAVPLSAIGNPAVVNTLWDVNNTVFLPTDYSSIQYDIVTGGPAAAGVYPQPYEQPQGFAGCDHCALLRPCCRICARDSAR